jgi:shikimate dehydrogenase
LSYEEIDKQIMDRYQVIINTTPLGTYPNTKECPPIPYEAISSKHILFDLVYNPSKTTFLARGGERGARIVNGYEMLVNQAEESWRIWNA